MRARKSHYLAKKVRGRSPLETSLPKHKIERSLPGRVFYIVIESESRHGSEGGPLSMIFSLQIFQFFCTCQICKQTLKWKENLIMVMK